jgi:hypothetical protein
MKGTNMSNRLNRAVRANAWFDSQKRQWRTAIMTANESLIELHPTQRRAFEHIGLKGGSQDPEFQPKGNNGYVVAVIA